MGRRMGILDHGTAFRVRLSELRDALEAAEAELAAVRARRPLPEAGGPLGVVENATPVEPTCNIDAGEQQQ